MSSAGTAAIPIKLPLSHGGGALFVKIAIPTVSPVGDAVVKAVQESALPNKLSAYMAVCACPLANLDWLCTFKQKCLATYLRCCPLKALLQKWTSKRYMTVVSSLFSTYSRITLEV